MATPGTHADETVNRLYADHAVALRTYVTRLLGDRHHAEDVVQETMLRAWQHADRLADDQRCAWPWLRRVAHNITIDRIRARRTRPVEVHETAGYRRATDDDHADRVATAEFVSGVVRGLGPKHRAVLYQVYVADHGSTAAADALGIPVGTVKSRLHDALRQARRAVDVQPCRQAAA